MSNYSLIRKFDTADGLGIRTAVYFSGCQKALEQNACPGCHNSVAWEKDAGKEWTIETQQLVLDSLKEDYITGLSILGGEPFSDFNIQSVLTLVIAAKEHFPDKDIWLWTGYNIEELLQSYKKDDVMHILKYVDIVVDGPFVLDLKEPNLLFRGSTNQKILSIKHEPFNIEDVTNSFMENQ